ncbi:MAG: hypothetical protein ACQER5_05685 [Pseudomonadota bacterium]
MGTKTGDANVIDYSEDYARLATALESIDDHLVERLDALIALTEAANALRTQLLETQQGMLERMSDESLGVYTRGAGDELRLSRAATINALKQSGQLDEVRDEMQSPTSMP